MTSARRLLVRSGLPVSTSVSPATAPYVPPLLLAAGAACVVLGFTVVRAPLAAFTALGVFLLLVLLVREGATRVTHLALCTIPFLVVLIEETPRLTLTLMSAATVLLLFATTRGLLVRDGLLWTGVAAFLTVLAIHLIGSTNGEQVTAAVKYCLFPATAVIVCTKAGKARLRHIRWWLLGSGLAAMTIQAASILLHAGATGRYYGAGEQLGLTADSPHELALVGVTTAIACLVCLRDTLQRVLGTVLAAAPALTTAVRSALVGLVLAIVVLLVRNRFRPSVVITIAIVGGAILYTGAGSIVASRFEKDEKLGEYSSFSRLGSGRGELWSAVLDRYETVGPVPAVFGSGLLSAEHAGEEELHGPNAVQSDPLAVIFEFGLIGLAGWALIWAAIVRAGANPILLIPLATYAITNGSLQYVGATVYCLTLAAAFSTAHRQRGSPVAVT